MGQKLNRLQEEKKKADTESQSVYSVVNTNSHQNNIQIT